MLADHDILPVTHSVLSTTALRSILMTDYDIGQPVKCILLNRGLNDTYLVETAIERYVLRIYRQSWRSVDDILYELDLLNHLKRKGISVSGPTPRRDTHFTRILRAPEGDRYAVLFTYASGEPMWSPDEPLARLYGQAAAEIHTALDDFVSIYPRVRLDLEHLIDRPLQTILPFLAERPDHAHYLQQLAQRLKERVTSLGSALEQGACHGDFHGGNCHISNDRHLTLFDFDCCGPSWRVYDVATFRWWTKVNDLGDTVWDAFLEGYTSRRSMRDADLAAVALFVPIRQIWLLGLHTSNADDWGHGWLDTGYFDRIMVFLREWEAEHGEPQGMGESL